MGYLAAVLVTIVPANASERWDTVVVGGTLMVLWYVLSNRLLLISQSYTIYAGAIGGFVAAVLFEERWDDGLESSFVAGLVAVPAAIGLLTVYDVVLTSRYDITLTNLHQLAAPPETLLSKVLVYGAYEVILGFYPLVLFLVGGMMGGVVGGKLGGIVRS